MQWLLSFWSTVSNVHGLQWLWACGMGDLPGPGIKAGSPVLAGRFLTTGHPGKSYAFNIATVLNQDCSRFFYSQITATHSSVLAWESLWTEEPGRLQFMGSPESDMT